MAEQLVEFAVQPGKGGPYHIGLCRRILKHVQKEKPSQRRFAIWLRQNQVYDRPLLQFLLKLCDVKVGKTATLGEAGEELAVEAQKGGAADMPAVPEPGAEEKPAPAKNAFHELLFDRFVEMNGYLPRFIFLEVADGFLATNEMVKRLGSSIYHGQRVPIGSFQNWLKWMEWLGYVKQVGFRHRLTDLGIEAYRYLKEIPEEELVAKGALGVLAGIAEDEGPVDERPFLTAEELGAPASAAAVPVAEPPPGKAGPAAPAPAAEAAGPIDEEEADFGPEGAPPPVADEALEQEEGEEERGAGRRPKEEAEISEEEAEAIQELFGEAAIIPERKPAPAARKPALAPAAPVPSGAVAVAPPPGPGEDRADEAEPEPEPEGEGEAETALAESALDAVPSTLDAAILGSAPETEARREKEEERAAETAYRAQLEEDAKAETPLLDYAALDARLAALTAEVGEIMKNVSAAEAKAALAAEGEPEAAPPPLAPPGGRERAAPVFEPAEPVFEPAAEREPGPAAEEEPEAEPRPEEPSEERPALASVPPATAPRRSETPTERFRAVAAEAPIEEAELAFEAADLALEAIARDAVAAALASPPLREDQVDLLAAQWEADPGRRPLRARDIGLEPANYPGEKRNVLLFKLGAAATILGGPGPFAPKLALLRKLERARVLDNMFTLDWTLERALDVLGLIEGPREVGPIEERLIHLARMKRTLALGGSDLMRRIEMALGRRAAVVRAVCGHAVGAGAYWVDREMRRLGLW